LGFFPAGAFSAFSVAGSSSAGFFAAGFFSALGAIYSLGVCGAGSDSGRWWLAAVKAERLLWGEEEAGATTL
jgi:hypothetical protein